MPEKRSSSKGRFLQQRVWLEERCPYDNSVIASRQMTRSEAEAFALADPNNFTIEQIDAESALRLFD